MRMCGSAAAVPVEPPHCMRLCACLSSPSYVVALCAHGLRSLVVAAPVYHVPPACLHICALRADDKCRCRRLARPAVPWPTGTRRRFDGAWRNTSGGWRPIQPPRSSTASPGRSGSTCHHTPALLSHSHHRAPPRQRWPAASSKRRSRVSSRRRICGGPVSQGALARSSARALTRSRRSRRRSHLR